MSRFILLLAISLCSLAHAEEPTKEVNLLYDTDAVLHICKGLLGCADKITIDRKEVLLQPLGFAKQELADIKACFAKSSPGIYDIGPGKVVGFIVKEKGHFPNPTVEFTVFKMLDTEIPPPC